MAGGIPPQGIGPGRGVGPGRGLGAGKSMGPGRIGSKRIGPSQKGPMLERGGKSAFSSQSPGKDSSLIKKGIGPFGHGRKPDVDKDGDPFTKRSPYKKPGNNSFL